MESVDQVDQINVYIEDEVDTVDKSMKIFFFL